MDYATFLHRVIEDGLAAARESYARKPDKLEGAVAGFEACRSRSPDELRNLLSEARARTARAHSDGTPIEKYWALVCYDHEVEWVCNCVSAVLMNQGLPTIVPPTARGVVKASQVAGVAERVLN